MIDGEIHVAMGNRWQRVYNQGSVDSPAAARAEERPDIPELTRAIKRGDHAAFEQFYGIYFPRLYRYLLVSSGGWEEGVQEALQESMIRVVRHMKPFTDEADLWNWLRRIARTALIDQVRRDRKSRRSVVPMSLADAREWVDRDAAADGSTELKHQLGLCLGELEQVERHLVEGKYLEGKSIKTLAAERCLTPKAVESRLARTRKKLKALILARLSR